MAASVVSIAFRRPSKGRQIAQFRIAGHDAVHRHIGTTHAARAPAKRGRIEAEAADRLLDLGEPRLRGVGQTVHEGGLPVAQLREARRLGRSGAGLAGGERGAAGPGGVIALAGRGAGGRCIDAHDLLDGGLTRLDVLRNVADGAAIGLDAGLPVDHGGALAIQRRALERDMRLAPEHRAGRNAPAAEQQGQQAGDGELDARRDPHEPHGAA